MMIRKGMKMEDVLAVREDIKKVSEEEWDGVLFEGYEGLSEDGGVLCIDAEDGVVVEVVKAMYV